MAEALDDGEFWLPSEFLTDDDIIMEGNKTGFRKPTKTGFETGFFFPSEFPYESSSPVESLGSESDEEDFLAGLTRQMARSLLQDTEYNSASAALNPKQTRVMSGSPQSPLCGMGSWSVGGGSSRGSPNGPSQVPSPPETPLNGKDDAWDLLYAAAGQVVRMKLNDEGTPNYGRGLLGVPQKPAPVSLPFKNPNPNVGCYPNQALARQQIQANHHFLQLKQQQQQQQQQQCSPIWGRQVKQNPQQILSGGRPVGIGNGRYNRPLGLPPSAWPPLQSQHPQNNGSGMRAVFLGGSGTRRECSGTGVFLPRRNGIASDSRRKPACSTVLLPDRVVQALNRSFDDMGGGVAPQQPHPHSHSQNRYVGVPAPHGNPLLSHQHKRSFRPQQTINTAEVQLPQEWTY